MTVRDFDMAKALSGAPVRVAKYGFPVTQLQRYDMGSATVLVGVVERPNDPVIMQWDEQGQTEYGPTYTLEMCPEHLTGYVNIYARWAGAADDNYTHIIYVYASKSDAEEGAKIRVLRGYRRERVCNTPLPIDLEL